MTFVVQHRVKASPDMWKPIMESSEWLKTNVGRCKPAGRGEGEWYSVLEIIKDGWYIYNVYFNRAEDAVLFRLTWCSDGQ